MLKRHFDLYEPYRVVIYLRMSDEKQNPRSPDQQLDEIKRTITNMNLPWTIVQVYRDDAVKGAYIRRRPEFQNMIKDFQSGAVKADLILVDTSERFGRSEELKNYKSRLKAECGVMILAANNQFVDPTTPQGKALDAFEDMRATEENRVKAHQVVRAKRDLVMRKLWSGGPAPFGYKIVPATDAITGEATKNSVIVPNEEEAWIVKEIFQRAFETGHGQTRLAKYFNKREDIPEKFKPFSGPTIGYRLDQEIYHGDIFWPKNCTGIVDDIRRVEANPAEEITHVPDYCPGIVKKETWMAVQAVRDERRKRKIAQNNQSQEEKLIKPLVPGQSVNYLLSGLARCGVCNASMRPVASGSKSKSGKTYCYHVCPRSIDGCCENKTYVPEDWLCKSIVTYIRDHLFTTGINDKVHDDFTQTVCFQDLCKEVQLHLGEADKNGSAQVEALMNESKKLSEQLIGFTMSLGNPKLQVSVRTSLEAAIDTATNRQHQIEAILNTKENLQETISSMFDNEAVLERLTRLDEVLAGNNPSRGNIELSFHIDRIDCFPDKRVVLRICKLGALGGAVEILKDKSDLPPRSDKTVKARRRARLSVEDFTDEQAMAAAEWATDPNRFAGLSEKWFEEEVFVIPEKVWPFQEKAISIAEERLKGLTHEALADKFNMTTPTVRKALKQAAKVDPRFKELPTKQPRARWHEDHALEVAARKAEGLGTNDLAKFFGKSDVTINKAVKFAASLKNKKTND